MLRGNKEGAVIESATRTNNLEKVPFTMKPEKEIYKCFKQGRPQCVIVGPRKATEDGARSVSPWIASDGHVHTKSLQMSDSV